jgi:hypothetical protein
LLVRGHSGTALLTPSVASSHWHTRTTQAGNPNYGVGCNWLNPLKPELNPSAQRCLTIFFYWGFCFLDRAFRKYMFEKPTNTPIIHSVY